MSHKKTPAEQNLLNEIHELMAQRFRTILSTKGKPVSAVTLNVIRQYLKDNDIVANINHSTEFDNLIELPAFDENDDALIDINLKEIEKKCP